ncbi:MAG: hypothetical protein FWG03_02260 [Clostridiales bacterium]|nr:hypothetical protein [Clostridiales bacterium]
MEAVKKYHKAFTLVICLYLFLTFGLNGTTYSFYYSPNVGVKNMLITKGSEVCLLELFDPDDQWLAGETKKKEVWFGNHCELDQVIRFKADTAWADASGSPWAYTGTYNPEPIVIGWTSEVTGAVTPATWTKVGDYYYYNRILEKQSGSSPTETAAVISSVTFSTALSNGEYYGDDFSDKTCKLTICMEALSVIDHIISEAWPDVALARQPGGTLVWTSPQP